MHASAYASAYACLQAKGVVDFEAAVARTTEIEKQQLQEVRVD